MPCQRRRQYLQFCNWSTKIGGRHHYRPPTDCALKAAKIYSSSHLETVQLTLLKELCLSVYDLNVLIQSDTAEWIDLFAQIFARFIARTQQVTGRRLTFQVLVNPDNCHGKSVLIYGDKVYPIQDSTLSHGYVYEFILHEILSQVKSHFLIHAGAVSRMGKGILIVADALHGKTTLVMELVRRGYRFLSDDIAAISRQDGQVYPYPRSLRIRPAALQRLRLTLPEGTRLWEGKYILDIEALFPGRMETSVPIQHILFLTDPESLPEGTGKTSHNLLYLYIDRQTPQFISDLGGLEGVTDLSIKKKNKYTVIILTTTNRDGVLAQSRSLCDKHNLLLLETSNRFLGQPTFISSPRLDSISPSQATLFLLQRLKNPDQPCQAQVAPRGQAVHLYTELANLISHASCWRLSVGPLDQMADLIEELDGEANG
jgi:hypothetical protein